jgi:hypothetical protein
MIIAAVGCCALGVSIGGLVSLYVVSTDRFNLGALTGATATLVGAGVIAVFIWLTAQAQLTPCIGVTV